MKKQRRYIVVECLQPGFGEEDWNEVESFESFEKAVECFRNAPNFKSRDILSDSEETILQGWRIEE